MTEIALIISIGVGAFGWGILAGYMFGAKLRAELNSVFDRINGKKG